MKYLTPRVIGLRLTIAAAGLGAVLAAGVACGSTEPTAIPIERTAFNDTLKIDLARFTKLPSGMYVRDSIAGTGATVAQGQSVTVGYLGYFPDGRVFDPGSSPYTFTLGAGQSIPGFEIGVLGMKVGGRRTLIIPPELGYGATGNRSIPPYAVLLFSVTVQRIN
jgi:peptidylprolyl isomerase